MKRILEKDELSLDDQKVLVSLVRRIGDISNQILGLKNRPLTKEESLTVSETAKMIIDEKKLQFSMFKNIKVSFKDNTPADLRTDFSSTDLARILSNIINNSFEALIDYEGFIELEMKNELGRVFFIVKDDGVGIPEERLKNINSASSSKKSGKGLGLSSSRKKILEAGGSFYIWSKQGSGTVVEFSLPVNQNSSHKLKTILLEDDKFIRLSWEENFRKSGLDLHTFSHPKILLESLDRFSLDDFFILDTCGQSEDFYELMNKLKARNPDKIFIYSGYDKKSLEKMKIPFQNIIPKDFDLRNIPH
ncbi:MAG: GHKL domain-containing protein [Alphaproteobacteria bacterium]|nr:GHKL domain-containing protein [Alphaproteobacteria bacterium]